MGQTKDYEYVDLGLPSGLKWAKCNVGANTETDSGYYFQWGEIEPHNTDIPYDWANYKYCNGTGGTLTKYCTVSLLGTVDNKRTLGPEDDAARANMGGDWRMPTQDELQELADNTDNEWIENFNESGVNGRKFTSRIDTSKYIFIPASGSRSNTSNSYGHEGYVWSSSIYTSYYFNARTLYVSSDSVSAGAKGRFFGFVVRGVL